MELKKPKATVWRNINSLVENNILREFKKGRSTVYQLNQNNYTVKELLIPLFLGETKLPIELAKRFCKNIRNKIKVAIVFGSAVRGEMKPTSDIDLALITDKQIKEFVDKSKLDFLDKYGIILSTHILAPKEFKRRYYIGDPFVLEIANGKVIIGNLEEVM
ncbi:MAG: nucleotidyltransferase domain-containing protein [Candidatus Thermoplasmatota archaeon]|nr:nucleotidyltransferase domain-containing protein [Candidatus Thermoplasmatota archaeon]